MPTPRLLSVLVGAIPKNFRSLKSICRNRDLQATVIVHILGKPYISFQHSICRNIDLPTCRRSDSSFERLIRALYIQRLNIVWIISRKISTGISRTRDFFTVHEKSSALVNVQPSVPSSKFSSHTVTALPAL